MVQATTKLHHNHSHKLYHLFVAVLMDSKDYEDLRSFCQSRHESDRTWPDYINAESNPKKKRISSQYFEREHGATLSRGRHFTTTANKTMLIRNRGRNPNGGLTRRRRAQLPKNAPANRCIFTTLFQFSEQMRQTNSSNNTM